MPSTDAAQLRRHSLRMARLTFFLFAGTFLAVVVPTLIGFALTPARGLPPALAFAAVLWMPVPFYLYALWAIRGAFLGFAAGGSLGSAIATGCMRAGVALAIGGALSAIGVPNVMRLLLARGGPVIIDIAYLAVAAIGLALILVGRLLAEAQPDPVRLEEGPDGAP